METLDQTDIRLLKLLQEDSNRPIKELAKLVNLSATPVAERIRRLEREGYIKKYAAILSNSKLNKGFIVFCNVRLKQHSYEYRNRFIETVSRIEDITECYNTSGDYDFHVKNLCSEYGALQKFHCRDTQHRREYRQFAKYICNGRN